MSPMLRWVFTLSLPQEVWPQSWPTVLTESLSSFLTVLMLIPPPASSTSLPSVPSLDPGNVLIAVGLKDASGKLFKYDPATKAVTELMEGLSGAAGCAVSSDGSFVLVSEFIKSNIKKYWIKGPKAGTIEDFSSLVSNPDNIRRVGSTGNFWVASVVNKVVMPTDPRAVKLDANGKVLQTIFLKNEFGNTLLSEVNEFNGHLYIGTLTGPFAGVMKL